jgi:hypothetical protein
VRKVKEGETTNEIFAFLTTEPNALVAPVHAKAMPVILTSADEIEQWMTAPTGEALKLQRPLPDGALHIVARGRRQDSPRNPSSLGGRAPAPTVGGFGMNTKPDSSMRPTTRSAAKRRAVPGAARS